MIRPNRITSSYKRERRADERWVARPAGLGTCGPRLRREALRAGGDFFSTICSVTHADCPRALELQPSLRHEMDQALGFDLIRDIRPYPKRLRSPERDVWVKRQILPLDEPEMREPMAQCLDRNFCLEFAESGPEAVVNALTERKRLRSIRPLQIECLRLLEDRRISTRGSEDECELVDQGSPLMVEPCNQRQGGLAWPQVRAAEAAAASRQQSRYPGRETRLRCRRNGSRRNSRSTARRRPARRSGASGTRQTDRQGIEARADRNPRALGTCRAGQLSSRSLAHARACYLR